MFKFIQNAAYYYLLSKPKLIYKAG